MLFRFENFTLDTELLEFTQAGTPVKLEPQVFSLLVYLIDNLDRVVSKDELIEHVWDGRIVSDTTLNTRINALRRAVGDSGAAQAVIRTFARRGFRFVAELTDEAPRKPPSDATPTEAPADEKTSIAVLPFDNVSDDAEQDYFVEGLCEDIITILSKISGLLVISRNSSFRFRGRGLDLPAVAEKLGVRYLVTGSVRKSGNRIRLTGQLIDSQSDQPIWAERYDRRLDDVFEVQDDITREIVTALQVTLADGEQARVWRRQAGGFDAYEFFAKGRDLYMQFNAVDNAESASQLDKALKITPNFAAAQAFMAWTKTSNARFGWGGDKKNELAQARQWAEKAIASAPDDGMGHAAMVLIEIIDGNPTSGLAYAKKSVELSPNNSDCWQNVVLSNIALGNWLDAISAAKQSLRLNPLVPENCLVERARAYFHLGQYENCLSDALQVVGRQPEWLNARVLIAGALHQLGRSDEAQQHIARIMADRLNFSLGHWGSFQFYQRPEDLQVYLDRLRAAGFS